MFCKKIKEVFKNASVFRTCYIIISFLEMIFFLENLSYVIKSIFLFWGICIVLYFLFKDFRQINNIEYKKIFSLFILEGFIAIFLNISPDFFTNLAFNVQNIVLFFLFFGSYYNTEKSILKKEIEFIFNFIIYASSLISFIGIIVIILCPQIIISNFKIPLIIQNRFVGFYTNSNLAAFNSVISIALIDLMNKFKKNNIIINITLIIINICTLFFSDSNASFLFIIIYLTVKIFIWNFIKYPGLKQIKFIREFSFLIVCVTIIISGSLLARSLSQKIISLTINRIHNSKNNKVVNTFISEIIVEEKNINNVNFGRQNYKKNYDISSGRITLLKQGIKLFKKHPFFGIGRGNLVNFAKIYLDGGLIFSDLHNSYLTILVSYGIVGFFLFVVFIINILTKMFYEVFFRKYLINSEIISIFMTIILSYLTYAVFEKAIISEITFMVTFFWLILGYTWLFVE